ncbi:respiratory complex assembly protein Rmp1 [Aspergillus steynii IBT 23096]|uniref:Respiratory complex assembly protein Rmp1 n=1 Tax=Aspergillus steynii IBT 23096 TaxID=1392250 RepID=A0A2I2G1Q6_9EURO|nr:respiratory complex assembly protein Rmp1 [Aspergillus steynii IBT 23096]PLB46793.1 respiratory complex assembly protein Rmp1 [Aspergillus steynii IBT 23096]
MQAFVPKNRRPRFELVLRIIDLNNVPLVNGTAYVKWRLPSSSAAEHHGHTDKAVILDHRAYWNYEKTLPVRLTIDRNQTLHECEIHFEIIQEFEAGATGEARNILGRIRLNLSEYVEKSDDREGVTRRYLMQESKINSTLKIAIAMHQVEGDRNFTTPPLKSAMVFGGIAGVVSAEQGDPVDLGRMPSINVQSREAADMQDMYRRTLAASWNSRPDDLPADKLIEELFSGSISWSNDTHDTRSGKTAEHDTSTRDETGTRSNASNRLSPSFERRPRSSGSNQLRHDVRMPEYHSAMGHTRKSGSIEQNLYSTAKANAWRSRSNSDYELSEFDVREDLKSWEISSKDSQHSKLDEHYRRQFSRNRRTPTTNPRDKKRQLGKKLPISVTSLGEPGEVLVVEERNHRQFPAHVQDDGPADQDSLSLMLEDIDALENPTNEDSVTENIELLRRYKPRDRLSFDEWHDHRQEILKSFTNKQLSAYILEFVGDEEGEVLEHGKEASARWRPGISTFLEPADELDSNRIMRSQDNVKAKDLLVERILRDCWKLGIMGEAGQLDYKLSPPLLSLLARSTNFSFEVLASLHDAQIDLTHSLGLVRITGSQKACETLRDVVEDATAAIRQEDIQLYSQDAPRAQPSNRVLSPEFLSWVSTTYGVVFEEQASEPSKLFYLAENKQGAEDARRTLNLAIYDKTAPQAPFGTYLSASQPIECYDVNPEDNTTWWNREKRWFRWAMPPAQSAVAKVLEMPFFDNHETRLSGELLKILRQKSHPKVDQTDGDNVRETVSAAVGKCLFVRKSSPMEESISAKELGKLSAPRCFTTDIPRVTSILRRLPFRVADESIRNHRIQLVPSLKYANVFPDLDVEFTVRKEHGGVNPRTEVLLQSAKMVLSKGNVDYLLPENALDLRFTRTLTRELLEGPRGNYLLQNLQEVLEDAFAKARANQEDKPLPAFIDLSLPNDALRTSTENQDPSGQTAAEYMFLPVRDIQGTRITRYGYRDHELKYSYYESGPYYAHRTTDFFLDMDITEGLSDPPADQLMQGPEDFNSFYKAACELAFDGDKAWRAPV